MLPRKFAQTGIRGEALSQPFLRLAHSSDDMADRIINDPEYRQRIQQTLDPEDWSLIGRLTETPTERIIPLQEGDYSDPSIMTRILINQDRLQSHANAHYPEPTSKMFRYGNANLDKWNRPIPQDEAARDLLNAHLRSIQDMPTARFERKLGGTKSFIQMPGEEMQPYKFFENNIGAKDAIAASHKANWNVVHVVPRPTGENPFTIDNFF